MVRILNKTADGNASKFEKWYALAHAAGCTPCRNFLMSLEQLVEKLKSAREVPEEGAIARMSQGEWRQLLSEMDPPETPPKF